MALATLIDEENDLTVRLEYDEDGFPRVVIEPSHDSCGQEDDQGKWYPAVEVVFDGQVLHPMFP